MLFAPSSYQPADQINSPEKHLSQVAKRDVKKLAFAEIFLCTLSASLPFVFEQHLCQAHSACHLLRLHLNACNIQRGRFFLKIERVRRAGCTPFALKGVSPLGVRCTKWLQHAPPLLKCKSKSDPSQVSHFRPYVQT